MNVPEPPRGKRIAVRVAVFSPLILLLIGLLWWFQAFSTGLAEFLGVAVLVTAVVTGWRAARDPQMHFRPLSRVGKIGMSAIALVLGLVVSGLHWLFVGGWCGYFDDGPHGAQTWYCNHGGYFSLIPGTIIAVGVIVASRGSSARRTFVPLAVALLGACVFVIVIPFSVISRG